MAIFESENPITYASFDKYQNLKERFEFTQQQILEHQNENSEHIEQKEGETSIEEIMKNLEHLDVDDLNSSSLETNTNLNYDA